MYDCLPMYHTVGGVRGDRRGAGRRRLGGHPRKILGARVLGRRRRHDCTLFQYIGELCRYLAQRAAAPEGDAATASGSAAATACGPTSGRISSSRFGIPHILEFYAATEGNAILFNFDGKPGAVGRVPRLVAHRFPIAIVRFDIEREQPVRGADGFCIACAPDEVGEAIGRIMIDPREPGHRFEGYADRPRPRRRSCATSSSTATPGSAPAT